ncbi:Late embryogenesis abundant protein, LEA_2 subgroup, partial [Dillenia turbinata]
MASSDKSETVERDDKEKDHKDQDKDEEKGGFIKMVTDSIHDIGKKIEGAIGFGKPTASISEIDIPKIDLERAEIVVDVLITNPHPDPISLIISIYLIESEGRKLISGLIPHDGTIKPHGSETVKISVTLIYDDIKNTYDDIKPGSIIPYEIKVDLIVVVPIIGRIAIPLEKEGKIPIPPCKLDIDVKKIHFQTSSSGETVAILHLKLENKYDFDLGIVSLVYTLSLAGQSIQDKKNLESTNIVKKSGASSMEIPITFKDPSVLRGKAEVSYTMEGHIEVDRPFGRMKLPISKEGGYGKASLAVGPCIAGVRDAPPLGQCYRIYQEEFAPVMESKTPSSGVSWLGF